MGSRSSQRFTNRSTSNHHRLSDGLHQVPSAITLWPCEMTDLSPGFVNSNQQQYYPQQQQLYQQLPHHSNFPTASGHNNVNLYNPSSRIPPMGNGSGRLFSYFGNDNERERKKSETSFFNLGFRRKSTIYYAATD